MYPRIIGRQKQNQPILYNILYGVPKFLVFFYGGGVQYILGLLAGRSRISRLYYFVWGS